jgi:peptide/nickel transport system ATP-binding protein
MYGGEIIERGATGDVLRAPSADYSRRLLTAVPRIEGPARPGSASGKPA